MNGKKNGIALFLFMLLSISSHCGTNTDTVKDVSAEKTSKMKKIYTAKNNVDSIIIGWLPPAMQADSVDYYELFYCPVGDSSWRIAKRDIPATKKPQVKVYNTDIDSADLDTVPKAFYFGVRSVTKSGMKSDFNFSSDTVGGTRPWEWVVRHK